MSDEDRLAADAVGQLARNPQGRRVLLIIAIIALVIFCGHWLWVNAFRARHVAGPTIRLATWNLREFSIERKEVDLRAIAQIITANHFDLVAIQEVKRNGEEVDRLLNVLGAPWRATSFSPITGNHERFAYIYDGDRVQTVGSAHFIDSSQAAVFDRTPYEASFRAGPFDFTLVTVHLSWGDVRRRQQEARALANFAESESHSGATKHLIVLGDFNERPPGNLHYFEEMGWKKLIADSTNLGSTETYDELLIDPKATPEWDGASGSVHFDETMFANDDKQAEKEVSDHRPAWADFATSN